jgi:hypothetical protein
MQPVWYVGSMTNTTETRDVTSNVWSAEDLWDGDTLTATKDENMVRGEVVTAQDGGGSTVLSIDGSWFNLKLGPDDWKIKEVLRRVARVKPDTTGTAIVGDGVRGGGIDASKPVRGYVSEDPERPNRLLFTDEYGEQWDMDTVRNFTPSLPTHFGDVPTVEPTELSAGQLWALVADGDEEVGDVTAADVNRAAVESLTERWGDEDERPKSLYSGKRVTYGDVLTTDVLRQQIERAKERFKKRNETLPFRTNVLTVSSWPFNALKMDRDVLWSQLETRVRKLNEQADADGEKIRFERRRSNSGFSITANRF